MSSHLLFYKNTLCIFILCIIIFVYYYFDKTAV